VSPPDLEPGGGAYLFDSIKLQLEHLVYAKAFNVWKNHYSPKANNTVTTKPSRPIPSALGNDDGTYMEGGLRESRSHTTTVTETGDGNEYALRRRRQSQRIVREDSDVEEYRGYTFRNRCKRSRIEDSAERNGDEGEREHPRPIPATSELPAQPAFPHTPSNACEFGKRLLISYKF